MQPPNDKTLAFYAEFHDELDKNYKLARKDRACCNVHTKFFYPEAGGDPFDVIPRFCAKCPTHLACLFYSLGKDEAGIWGGATQRIREDVAIQVRKITNNPGATIWTEHMWDVAKEVAIQICYSEYRTKGTRGRPKKSDKTLPNPMHSLVEVL